MKIKKALFVIMALIFVLSLAACSRGSRGGSGSVGSGSGSGSSGSNTGKYTQGKEGIKITLTGLPGSHTIQGIISVHRGDLSMDSWDSSATGSLQIENGMLKDVPIRYYDSGGESRDLRTMGAYFIIYTYRGLNSIQEIYIYSNGKQSGYDVDIEKSADTYLRQFPTYNLKESNTIDLNKFCKVFEGKW